MTAELKGYGLSIQNETPVDGQNFKEEHGTKQAPKAYTIGLMVLGSLGILFGGLCLTGGIACAASGYGAPAAIIIIPIGASVLVGGIGALGIGIISEIARKNEIKRHKFNTETDENKMDKTNAADIQNLSDYAKAFEAPIKV